MSQQGTPLGLLTLLNQERILSGMFSNWPWSVAWAPPAANRSSASKARRAYDLIWSSSDADNANRSIFRKSGYRVSVRKCDNANRIIFWKSKGRVSLRVRQRQTG